MALNAANFLFQLRPRLGGKVCRIYAYDANHTDPSTGHMRIDVEVFHGPECIFRVGETYCAVNRWTAPDSDAAKALVLSLVAMKPGDTDSDYFEHYTPEQLAFAEAYGDELTMIRYDRFGEDS